MKNKIFNKFYKPDERMPNEVLSFEGIDNAFFSYNPNPYHGNMANSEEIAFVFESDRRQFYIKYADLRKKIEEAKNIHDAVKIFMDDSSEKGFRTSCKEKDVFNFLETIGTQPKSTEDLSGTL